MVYWYLYVILVKLAEKKHVKQMAADSGELAHTCDATLSGVLISQSDMDIF